MGSFTPSSNLNETAGFLGGLVKQSRLAWRLLRDRRVPAWVKIIPFAGLLYFLSPLDLIPELGLPLLGELDDVAILLLVLKTFVDLSPVSIVREHLESLSGVPKGARQAASPSSSTTIDGDYRILDDSHSERRTQDK